MMGIESNFCCAAERQKIDLKNIKFVNREWTPVKLSNTASELQKMKEYMESEEMPVPLSLNVKMMHWNVLADTLSQGSFDNVPKDLLGWEYRWELMKQHFSNVDPDVLGLSEVDLDPMMNAFEEFMSKRGYDSYFVPKTGKQQGSAIFYKKEKFVCLKKNSVTFGEDSSQFFMYVHLVKRSDAVGQKEEAVPNSGGSNSNKKMQFIFGETHLKAKK